MTDLPPARFAGATIAAKSMLASARVVAQSFTEHHPDAVPLRAPATAAVDRKWIRTEGARDYGVPPELV
jgi:hypothetical protein